MSDLAKLLDILGRDHDERLSLNGLIDGRFRSMTVLVSTAVRWVPDPAKDCWYGTAALHPRVTSGRGYAKDVVGVRELSADLDVKPTGLPSWDAARQVVDTLATMLGVGPAAVINSGHGLQPHWALERSDRTDWPDETDPRWTQAVALCRRWGRLVASVAERYGGRVDSVFDLSRVLRVPGTTNTKGDPHVPVTVEWFTAPPVSLDRLADTLDEYGIDELAGDRDVLSEGFDIIGGVRASQGGQGQPQLAVEPCRHIVARIGVQPAGQSQGHDTQTVRPAPPRTSWRARQPRWHT